MGVPSLRTPSVVRVECQIYCSVELSSPEGDRFVLTLFQHLAHALLNKEVGDEAIVKTPAAQFVWRITKIEYQK